LGASPEIALNGLTLGLCLALLLGAEASGCVGQMLNGTIWHLFPQEQVKRAGQFTFSGMLSPDPIGGDPPGSTFLTSSVGDCILSSDPVDSDAVTNGLYGSWGCTYTNLPEGLHTEQLAYTFHNQGAAPGVPPPPGYPDSCAAQTQFKFRVDGTSPTVTAVYPEAPVPLPSGFPGMVMSSSDTVRLAVTDNLMLCEVTASTGPDSFGFVSYSTVYKNPMSPDSLSPYSAVYAPGATSKAIALRLTTASGPVIARAFDCAGLTAAWEAPFKIDSQAPRVSISAPAGVVNSPGGLQPLTGIAGTASDDIGLAKLELEVQDSVSGRWWDGAAFVDSGEPVRVLLEEAVDGSTAWSHPELADAPIPAQGAVWNVRVVATDFVGRTGQATSPITIKPPTRIRRVRPTGEVDARGPRPWGFTDPIRGTGTECW
jgi:hypothetical protein